MFQYYGGGNQGLQGLQYPSQQQPAQKEQSQDMGSMMGLAQQFMGSGSGAAGAGGSQAAGNLAASEGIGSAGTIGGGGWAGGGSASGTAAGGSAMAGGLWAALAAVIAANEYNAKGQGRRSSNEGEHLGQIASGEVYYKDAEEKILPALGLEEGSTGNKAAAFLLSPLGGAPKIAEKLKDWF